MKYFATSFFTLISGGALLYTLSSATNSSKFKYNKLYDRSVQSCEVEVLAYFIFDPKVMAMEKLKGHVDMMNSMFTSCVLTSENICAKLLITAAGKTRLVEAGLHKFVEVVHIKIAEKFSTLHHWYLMYHVAEQYLQTFASRHIIFLDIDVLATGKNFKSIL